jgi:hypothetical protein
MISEILLKITSKEDFMETKLCSKCGKEQPIEYYPLRIETGKYRPECKICWNAYQRERYLEKLGKHKRTARAEAREADPKRCIKCGVEKPLSEYTIHNRKKGQHRNFCHECEKQWIRKYHKTDQGKQKAKEWIDNNKEKILEYREIYKTDILKQERSKAYHRARWLRLNFNMTVDDYMDMFEKQDGKCLICGIDKNILNKNFAIDHDHTTGKVRGLLCHNCNVSIGLMKDSPFLLHKAAEYLDSFNH